MEVTGQPHTLRPPYPWNDPSVDMLLCLLAYNNDCHQTLCWGVTTCLFTASLVQQCKHRDRAAAVHGSAARPRFYGRGEIISSAAWLCICRSSGIISSAVRARFFGREDIISSAARPRFYGREEIISSAAWLCICRSTEIISSAARPCFYRSREILSTHIINFQADISV